MSGFSPCRPSRDNCDGWIPADRRCCIRLRNADRECPDVGLMDVYMPQMDGFEATRRLTQAHPTTVVVLVSLEDVEDLAADVAACGAVAFLHKRDLRPATLRELWRTHGGDR
jgi:DNA-binding NarL/FixJ family response regulator